MQPPRSRTFARVEGGTTAFNGFEAEGNWTVGLFRNGMMLNNTATPEVVFEVQPCDAIAPAAECFGPSPNGKIFRVVNISADGSLLSNVSTPVTFDVDLNQSCCVANVTGAFDNGIDSVIPLAPLPSAIAGNYEAEGQGPDGVANPLTVQLFGNRLLLGSGNSFAGEKAAGTWTLNVRETTNVGVEINASVSGVNAAGTGLPSNSYHCRCSEKPYSLQYQLRQRCHSWNSRDACGIMRPLRTAKQNERRPTADGPTLTEDSSSRAKQRQGEGDEAQRQSQRVGSSEDVRLSTADGCGALCFIVQISEAISQGFFPGWQFLDELANFRKNQVLTYSSALMPRGHGRRRRKEVDETSVEAQERAQRTVIFSKTKMCKFHILGACTKGAACKFAHQKEELQELPDLACTKLCKMLISTGSCDDPDCRYAHNRSELKEIPGLPSPLLDQLRETEAVRLADAAKAAAKAAAESNDAQRQKSNEQLQQQLRQQLTLLEQATGPTQSQKASQELIPEVFAGQESSRATMPGIALQAVPTALPPEVAAQLFPNLPIGGAILSPAALDAGFLINLSNVVTAQTPATMPWAVGQATSPGLAQLPSKRQEPSHAAAKAAPKKDGKHKKEKAAAGHKQELGKRVDNHSAGKVLSLASELPKTHTADQQTLAAQVQQQLQMQLQHQQEIQKQLRTQLATQPTTQEAETATVGSKHRQEQKAPMPDLDAEQSLQGPEVASPHVVVDADPAPATSYPRINTWSGGLNEMEEDLLDDPVLELGPLEKVEQSPLAIGLHENFRQIIQQMASQPPTAPQMISATKETRETRGLHRVPEDKRLTGMGRQISECSETSVTSTDTPSTEKRLQDTPLQPGRRRSSDSGSSPFSAVHEEDEDEIEEGPSNEKELGPDMVAISPNTKLNQNFGAIAQDGSHCCWQTGQHGWHGWAALQPVLRDLDVRRRCQATLAGSYENAPWQIDSAKVTAIS
eukprot:s735_g4.t1